MTFSIPADLVGTENKKHEQALADDYASLGRQLQRRGGCEYRWHRRVRAVRAHQVFPECGEGRRDVREHEGGAAGREVGVDRLRDAIHSGRVAQPDEVASGNAFPLPEQPPEQAHKPPHALGSSRYV